MVKRFVSVAAVAAILIAAGGAFEDTRCESEFGGGIHYLRTLGEMKDVEGWDENAIGWMLSYRLNMGLMKIEADLEWVPDFGGTDESLYQPQAWLVLGGIVYGSAGIGWSYFNDGWLHNPFYGLRAGVDLPLGGINLDVFTTYRFHSSTVFEEFDESDLDHLTFGALVRF